MSIIYGHNHWRSFFLFDSTDMLCYLSMNPIAQISLIRYYMGVSGWMSNYLTRRKDLMNEVVFFNFVRHLQLVSSVRVLTK